MRAHTCPQAGGLKMGNPTGGGYRGSPSSFRVLRTNIDRLAAKYPLDRDRRFGKRVSERISEIQSDDPGATAKEFWKALSRGGVVQEIKTKYGTGRIATFDDKSHVVYRPVTKSSIVSSQHNPGIEIDIRTSGHGFPPRYKIHFRKGGQS